MKANINTKSTLHILNASPFEHRVLFDRMIRLATPGDNLLLIENGVYAITNDYCLRTIYALGMNLFCLEIDITARGLHNTSALANTMPDIQQHPIIELINDIDFVNLCGQHHKVVSWFP